MAQYNITATSAKKEMTVSNTDSKFASPAEFETHELAQAQADKYANHLNHDDHEGAWDWEGQASEA